MECDGNNAFWAICIICMMVFSSGSSLLLNVAFNKTTMMRRSKEEVEKKAAAEAVAKARFLKFLCISTSFSCTSSIRFDESVS